MRQEGREEGERRRETVFREAKRRAVVKQDSSLEESKKRERITERETEGGLE